MWRVRFLIPRARSSFKKCLGLAVVSWEPPPYSRAEEEAEELCGPPSLPLGHLPNSSPHLVCLSRALDPSWLLINHHQMSADHKGVLTF